MYKLKFFCLAVLLITAAACRKGDLPEAHYFGKVNVAQVDFEGASSMDVFFAGKKLGEVPKGSARTFMVEAGVKEQLKVFAAGTDKLVGDTVIEIPRNAALSFKLVYNETLGLKGFVGADTVAKDSIRLQLMYNIKKDFNPKEVDIHLFMKYGRPSVYEELTVLKGVKSGTLAPQIMVLPVFREDGRAFTYAVRLKDVKTGEFLMQEMNPAVLKGAYILMDPNADEYRGKYNIAILDDVDGDTKESNLIKAVIATF